MKANLPQNEPKILERWEQSRLYERIREARKGAATYVLHLHALRAKLDAILAREGRSDLARAAFDFLPARVLLDLEGWAEQDIFAH